MKLRECPFCGTTDNLMPSSGHMCCLNCGARGPYVDDHRTAEQHWNRRTPAAPPEPTYPLVEVVSRAATPGTAPAPTGTPQGDK